MDFQCFGLNFLSINKIKRDKNSKIFLEHRKKNPKNCYLKKKVFFKEFWENVFQDFNKNSSKID